MIFAMCLGPTVGFSSQYELTKRMDSTIIPQVNFSGMELNRVLEVLTGLSKEYSPDRKAVNYKVFLPAGGGSYDPRVNLSLRQLSISQITSFIARQINCKVSYANDGSYVIFNAPYVKPKSPPKNIQDPFSSKPSEQLSTQQMSVLADYSSRLRSRIDAAWVKPTQLAGVNLFAEAVFDVSSSGRITNVRLRRGSGNKAFDQSILAAFRSAPSAGPTPTGQPHQFSLPFRMGQTAQIEAQAQAVQRQAFVAPQSDRMPIDPFVAPSLEQQQAMASGRIPSDPFKAFSLEQQQAIAQARLKRAEASRAESFFGTISTDEVIKFSQSKAMAWANLVNGALTLLTSIVLTVYFTFTRAESLLSRLAIFASFTFCFLVTLIMGLSTGALLDWNKLERYFLPLVIVGVISLLIPFALMHILRWGLAAKDSRGNSTSKTRFKYRSCGRLNYLIQVSVLSGLVGGLASHIPIIYTNWLMIFTIIYIWFILAPRRAVDAGMPAWIGFTVGIPIISIYSNYICLGAQKDYASADRIDAKGLVLVLISFFLGGLTLCVSSAYLLSQH